MTKRKPSPINPHHIINEVDDAEVKELSVKRNLRQVAVVSPDSTVDEIKAMCKADHGPGKYRITAIGVSTGRQLRGYRSFEIRDGGRPGSQSHSPMTGGEPTSFWSEQQKTVQAQSEELADNRQRLEEDRERYVGEILTSSKQAQETERSLLDKFLIRQAELQSESEKRRQELDDRYRADEARRRDEQELKLAEIENKRLELEAKINSVSDKKYELEVEHERKLFELKFDQMQEANKRERELDRQALELERKQMEIETKQRESEMDKKYGLSAESGVPQEVLSEIAWRRMDEEFPQKSDLEKVMEKYISPIIEYFQNPEFQKRLAGSQGARVSSPQPPPSAAPVDDDVEVAFSSDDF